MLFLFCNISIFLDQDCLSLLLITGRNLITGGNASCSGELLSDTVTSRVSHSPAPRERGAGAGQGLTGSRQGGAELGISAAVPAAHMCVAQWQPNLFLGQTAVI